MVKNYISTLIIFFVGALLVISCPSTSQAAFLSFKEESYETNANIAWNWAAVSPTENKITFMASPCSVDVYLQAQDGYWEGILGTTEGVACSSLDAAFNPGQVIVHIVPVHNNDQDEILAFEVHIPQAIQEHVQTLDTSMFVEDFFTQDVILYALPGADENKTAVYTLEDPQTNNSVPLYHTGGDPTGENFLLYYNEKFDYTCWIPTNFLQVVLLPDNEDGLILETQDGQAQLRVSGGFTDFIEGGLEGSFNEAKAQINGPLNHEEFIEDEWKAYWKLQGQEGDMLIVRKFIIRGDYYCDLSITYPAAAHAQYAAQVETVVHNFNREFEDW